MQISGQRFSAAAEGDFDTANFVVGVLDVFGVHFVFLVVEQKIVRRVFEDGPLRSGVQVGGEEIAFARGNHAAVFFILARFFFAAHGGAGELARNVVEFVNARAQSGGVRATSRNARQTA